VTGAQSEQNQGRPVPQLETSVPGVFAVGDVRSGSVKRVGGAIGEGRRWWRRCTVFSEMPQNRRYNACVIRVLATQGETQWPTSSCCTRRQKIRQHSTSIMPRPTFRFAKKLPGLRKYQVSQGPVATPAGPSGIYLIATLTFDSMAAIQNAFGSAEGKVTAADLPKFATGGADLMFFDAKAV